MIAESSAFLDDLAQRVAAGVASVCVVLDPGLVVLGGAMLAAVDQARAALLASVADPSRPSSAP